MQDFGDLVILPRKLIIAEAWDSQCAKLATRVSLTEEGFYRILLFSLNTFA